MRTLIRAAFLAAALAAPAAAELPDLGGREVVVVTENAYPPLQFVEPGSGEAIGWEYEAMAEIAESQELLASTVGGLEGWVAQLRERLGN